MDMELPLADCSEVIENYVFHATGAKTAKAVS